MARILIVDDDEIIRDYLRVILEDNHQIHEARNGDEGLALYRKHLFDLVITDILMPVRDGIEMIMEIMESFPDARIIAISGGGRGLEASFNLEMAKNFGAMRVLEKPISPEEMRNAIADVLTQSQNIPNLPTQNGKKSHLPQRCITMTRKAWTTTSHFLHAIFPSCRNMARKRNDRGHPLSRQTMRS